ncbi:hypothetical protein [Ornithinicoccus hortensis]|uniref:hypothetical protein n=1 Tax=Ornithinicoccus hortensis TaxID=82346 RepID=UPI003144F1DA
MPLAARLTEDPEVRVDLIEAGAPDTADEIHIPAAFGALFKSEWDWDYDSELRHPRGLPAVRELAGRLVQPPAPDPQARDRRLRCA